MWQRSVLVLFALLSTCTVGAGILGAFRWRSATRRLRAKLEAARHPPQPTTYDAREVEGLPLPVRRFFHVALRDGQPLIAAARVQHEGQFNLSESKQRWSPFTSTQRVVTQSPGFDWDGRIRIAPGLNVFVHDAYLEGEGLLHAALLGLLTVADLRGGAEMAQSELLRFLAEAAWYPTALLPSQGVSWQAMDDTSARATLQDGSNTVSLEFFFNAEGLISTVRAAARYRTVGKSFVATPWQGKFWAYEMRHGMRIPLEGEVAWLLPIGPWPYWRGRIAEIAHEFAQ